MNANDKNVKGSKFSGNKKSTFMIIIILILVIFIGVEIAALVKSGKNTVLTLDLRLFFKNFSVNLQGCCLLFCCQGAYCPLTRSACIYYHLAPPCVNHFF